MSSRPFALEISMPDFMAAVDLQARLEATAPAQVVPAPEGSAVVLSVPQRALHGVLSSLAAWLDGYGLGAVAVRVNQRPYTIQAQAGGLNWRDADGSELDDVEH